MNQWKPRSRDTASQYHSGSATERRCRSARVAIPCAAMKRPMRVRAAASGSGRQMISSVLIAPQASRSASADSSMLRHSASGSSHSTCRAVKGGLAGPRGSSHRLR